MILARNSSFLLTCPSTCRSVARMPSPQSRPRLLLTSMWTLPARESSPSPRRARRHPMLPGRETQRTGSRCPPTPARATPPPDPRTLTPPAVSPRTTTHLLAACSACQGSEEAAHSRLSDRCSPAPCSGQRGAVSLAAAPAQPARTRPPLCPAARTAF